MDKGIDHCSSCVSEATVLRLASESGVVVQPSGWSPAVGFNLHFKNQQEYPEVCEDVVKLHERALAEKNLRRVTPNMSPDQEKYEDWIHVIGKLENAFNIKPIEISRIHWCLFILGMGSSNLEKVTDALGGFRPKTGISGWFAFDNTSPHGFRYLFVPQQPPSFDALLWLFLLIWLNLMHITTSDSVLSYLL